MDGTESPKKAVKKSVNRANDCCQTYKCSFNVKYRTGKSGCMSTQSLCIASNCSGSHGEVLASMSENIDVVFIKSLSLSKRIRMKVSKHVHGKFHILSLESKYMET